MGHKIKAKKIEGLTNPWVIIDIESGKVLDDAQGYGYKTAQKAHAAYAYKNRTPKQKKKHKQNKKRSKLWWSKHTQEADALSQYAFEIAKGSWGPDDKFDYNFFKSFISENEIDIGDCNLLSLWNYYLNNY